MNLQKTCAEAAGNFAERTKARQEEIKAVAEAIEILTADEARDAMSGTYNLLQLSASVRTDIAHQRRRQAANVLLEAGRKAKSPELSVLATAVEIDAFTRVKKAIDDMIGMLRKQQEDEVKKKDWCKSEIQENEMITLKTQDHKADLEAKIATLEAAIRTLEEEIAAGKAEIAQLQVDLQRASEDRVTENLEYQKTVADQAVVIEVLEKALDKLAKYYDKEALLQKGHRGAAKATKLSLLQGAGAHSEK